MLVVEAKLAELDQRIEYLRREFARCEQGAHPNLAARLTIRSGDSNELAKHVTVVRDKFSQYQATANPDFDAWKQIFAQLSEIANVVHFVVTLELPAYLAAAPDDKYVSDILEAIHKEVGLPDIKPVATLHQTGWWAVITNAGRHPLFFTPASVLADPGELPLVFHEIGHILFKRYKGLRRGAARVLKGTITRKLQEAQQASDPTDRDNRIQLITSWQEYARDALEETCCDVVGNLLGGPAFSTALAVGLLTISNTLFEPENTQYPPLDVRMRLCTKVLRHSGIAQKSADDAEQLSRIEDTWANVQDVYRPTQPPLYSWMYDDQYLEELTTVIVDYLQKQGLKLYEPGTDGLRGEMILGAQTRLSSSSAYELWAQAFLGSLGRIYS